MSIRVVQLGTPRHPEEGLRIGTVRRPPRGVPKTAFASENWYDVWFPNLAPSAELMKQGQAAVSDADWAGFVRGYQAEMAVPAARHDIQLLAALSHHTQLSVGCYCDRAERCHRSLLTRLLQDAGARFA